MVLKDTRDCGMGKGGKTWRLGCCVIIPRRGLVGLVYKSSDGEEEGPGSKDISLAQ